MACLKTGFNFRAEWQDENLAFHTDLFYCVKCKSFACNSIPGENICTEPDYKDGKFTEKFITERLEWYPDLTPLDFMTR
jgi:hypothetical protein